MPKKQHDSMCNGQESGYCLCVFIAAVRKDERLRMWDDTVKAS